MAEALGASWSTLGWALVNAVGIYAAVIVLTRLAGLRSFAKMSSFDFAMTVAVGSVIATTVASASVSLAQGVTTLIALYALQIVVAQLRLRVAAAKVVDNRPRLLMAGDRVLHDALLAGDVTEDDLRAKLREANVLHPRHVRAVVLETTGDISVLHSSSDEEPFDRGLLAGVIGAERLGDGDQPRDTPISDPTP